MAKLTHMSLDDDRSNDGSNRRRIHLREISGDSESPLETVGQDLRAARLRRGDEIAQVSRALKIRKDHLEALEEDRLEDLPGKTYAIGFVRSYARHLGLDAAQFVERFKQDISGRPDDTVHAVAPIHQDERRLPQGWTIIAALVGIALVYGGWHLLSSGNETNQTVPPAPVLSAPKPAAVHKPTAVVIPAQTATPSPALDSIKSAAQAAGAGQQSAMPTPAAGPKSPAYGASASTHNSAIAQESSGAGATAMPAVPATLSSGHVYGEQNRNPRIILRAHGDTRVTVRAADGSAYLNRDLKPGDSYLVPNMSGLILATSNAGAIEVDLDGASLGRIGEPQQILGRVSLDPQSLVDRFNAPH